MPPVLSLVVGRVSLLSFRHFPPPHRALSSFHHRYERTLHLPLSSSSSPTSSPPFPPFSLTSMVGGMSMSTSTPKPLPTIPSTEGTPAPSTPPSLSSPSPLSSPPSTAKFTKTVSPPVSWDRPPSDELAQLLSTMGLGNISRLPPRRGDWNKPWRPWKGEKPSAEEVAELREYALNVYDGGVMRLDNNNSNNQSGRTFPFLCSRSNSRVICASLDSGAGRGGTIVSVPVDDRKAGRTVFNNWVAKADPTEDIRRPVLCNAAFAGSGKTVQLAFNMLSFQELKGGLSICITFNDDQHEFAWKPALDDPITRFYDGVALRVLHRALAALVGYEDASDAIRLNTSSMRETLAPFHRNPVTASLIAARELVGAPPKTKIFLAVDELSKIQEKTNAPQLSVVDLMSNLCSRYDADPSMYLCVSAYGAIDVTKFATGSNRTVYLQPLPPIFPVTPLAAKYVGLLPPILQVFANPDLRIQLPAKSSDGISNAKIFQELSQMFVESAGHPRRIEGLLEELSSHDGRRDGKPWNLDPKAFGADCDRFCIYLRTEEYISMDKLGISMVARVADPTLPSSSRFDVEQVARDTACKFKFSQPEVEDANNRSTNLEAKSNAKAESVDILAHASTLYGTAHGLCAFIPLPISAQAGSILVGHAFIPYTVLKMISEKEAKPKDGEPLPQAQAQAPTLGTQNTLFIDALRTLWNWLKTLFQAQAPTNFTHALHTLWNGLESYVEEPLAVVSGGKSFRSDGKGLEEVALGALLLYARANQTFYIKDICRQGAFGELCEKPRLLGGATDTGKSRKNGINLWVDIKRFPTEKPTKSLDPGNYDLRMLVNRLLKSKASGAVFKPTDPSNPCGDVYGLFREDDSKKVFTFLNKPNLVLLVLQCKDWFKPESLANGNIKLMQEWRKLRKDVHCEGGRYPFVHNYDKYPKDSDSMKTSQCETFYDLGNATVRVVHVLFTSNRYEATVKVNNTLNMPSRQDIDAPTQLTLVANEGIFDLESMRTWLPTAAYSAELIHRMRHLFLEF